tara:strand:+ start:2213 stop:2695 length:483 start_codon:yes stop_codon:yes gene_type:complete
MGKIEVKCQGCGIRFDCSNRKYKWNTKIGSRIFCSYDCFQDTKQKEKRVSTHCAKCGKTVFKLKTEISKSKTGNVYCSRSCSNSKNNSIFRVWDSNPNFKHGKSHYRKQKLKVSENVCEDCGNCDIDVLEIHHKDGNRSNNDMDNLSILCSNCHKKRHKK